MTLTPNLRKLALTAHVASSVGWFGAVVVFLAFAVTGLTSQDAWRVRAAYLAAELATWSVIVPLAFASLLTGVAVSLGSEWGLFRHYWVLVKFLLTVGAVGVLLIHTQPIGRLAGVAAVASLSSAEFHQERVLLVVASGGALLVLLAATALSVYKPRGMTRYGWRKLHESRALQAEP